MVTFSDILCGLLRRAVVHVPRLKAPKQHNRLPRDVLSFVHGCGKRPIETYIVQLADLLHNILQQLVQFVVFALQFLVDRIRFRRILCRKLGQFRFDLAKRQACLSRPLDIFRKKTYPQILGVKFCEIIGRQDSQSPCQPIVAEFVMENKVIRPNPGKFLKSFIEGTPFRTRLRDCPRLGEILIEDLLQFTGKILYLLVVCKRNG